MRPKAAEEPSRQLLEDILLLRWVITLFPTVTLNSLSYLVLVLSLRQVDKLGSDLISQIMVSMNFKNELN